MDNRVFIKKIILEKKSLCLIFIALLAILTTGCSSLKNDRDKWFAKDKLYHFATAGAVSAALTSVAKANGSSDSRSAVAGVSITLALGAGKESYDKKVKKTFFSLKDMVWNLIGAVTGSLLVNTAD